MNEGTSTPSGGASIDVRDAPKERDDGHAETHDERDDEREGDPERVPPPAPRVGRVECLARQQATFGGQQGVPVNVAHTKETALPGRAFRDPIQAIP